MSHIGLDTYQQGTGPTWSGSQLISARGPMVMAGDFLRLSATTADATGVLALNGRLVDTVGTVRPFSTTLTFSGIGAQTAVTVPLMDGWIIGFTVYVVSGTITDGEVEVAVDVVQGSGTGATPVMTLASGEVTSTRRLGMAGYIPPTSTAIVSSGTLTTTLTTSPAAGAEYTVTVPAAQTWTLISHGALFTSSATGANRYPRWTVDDGTNAIISWSHSGFQIASCANRYNAGPGASTQLGTPTTVGNFMFGIPRIVMSAGWRISTTTTNIQSGDTYTAIATQYYLT